MSPSLQTGLARTDVKQSLYTVSSNSQHKGMNHSAHTLAGCTLPKFLAAAWESGSGQNLCWCREVNAEICYASKYVSESYKDCLLTAMGTSEWHTEPCIQLNINCWSECQQEHVTGPVHGGCEVGISPLLFNHSPLERTHSRHKGARA